MKENSIEYIITTIEQEMEYLDDTIELLQMARKLEHPFCPATLKALKESFMACDAEDWPKCRSALDLYLDCTWEYILEFDVSQWSNRHLFRWKKMLEATDLAYDTELDLYPTIYAMVKEEILIRIPLNFRLAYKDNLNDLSPGFIDLLQNYANDPSDDELWKEINDFMERDIDAEDKPNTLQ